MAETGSPVTPLSRAFAGVRATLRADLDGHETEERLLGLLEGLTEEVRIAEREAVAARLDDLSAGRMEYVVGVSGTEPTTALEVQMLPGMGMVIYGEATGARWLARIIRGESDRGWLPSWRWY